MKEQRTKVVRSGVFFSDEKAAFLTWWDQWFKKNTATNTTKAIIDKGGDVWEYFWRGFPREAARNAINLFSEDIQFRLEKDAISLFLDRLERLWNGVAGDFDWGPSESTMSIPGKPVCSTCACNCRVHSKQPCPDCTPKGIYPKFEPKVD